MQKKSKNFKKTFLIVASPDMARIYEEENFAVSELIGAVNRTSK